MWGMLPAGILSRLHPDKRNLRKEDTMIRSYIALDIETTGLNPKSERITEVAALRVEEGEIRDCFSTLINPERPLDARIIQLTGITDEMVAGAPPIAAVIGEFLEFCGSLPLLGHNLPFDYSFLKQAAVNQGLEFEKEGVDTLTLCRSVMPAGISRSLGNACEFYNISQPCAHRAEADARSAHLLYQHILGLYGEVQAGLFNSRPLIYKAKREQPATKRQKEYLQDLLKCHRIDVTVQMDKLSRSEASRLIDHIILTHGRN